MRSFFRKILRSLGNIFAECLVLLPGSDRLVERLLFIKMNSQIAVTHNSCRLSFIGANYLCRYRAESFSTKEPDTLEWIDSLPEGSVLWDIGANVGIYSIYAAKKKHCQVFSFEPSVFNLEILARNIYLNHLQRLVTIVPMALSDKTESNFFKMTSTNWGGALSTFSKQFDQNGKQMIPVFEYRIMGMTMEDAAHCLGISLPCSIKMDVDGIEHFILSGGINILKVVDNVLIEINDDFIEQAEVSASYLASAGLSLFQKRHMVGGQHNQWWVRAVS